MANTTVVVFWRYSKYLWSSSHFFCHLTDHIYLRVIEYSKHRIHRFEESPCWLTASVWFPSAAPSKYAATWLIMGKWPRVTQLYFSRKWRNGSLIFDYPFQRSLVEAYIVWDSYAMYFQHELFSNKRVVSLNWNVHEWHLHCLSKVSYLRFCWIECSQLSNFIVCPK